MFITTFYAFIRGVKEGRRDEVEDVTKRYRGGSEILQETLVALGGGALRALLHEERWERRGRTKSVTFPLPLPPLDISSICPCWR